MRDTPFETAEHAGAADATSGAHGLGMPRAVRLALWSVLGLLLAGAVGLVALRGNALILDLSAVMTRVFCL